MTAYLLTLHLTNFVLPALALALFLDVLGGLLLGRRSVPPLVGSRSGRLTWTVALNVGVLLAGLIWWGADGKMASYGVMTLVCALAQFVMWRGWRR